MAVTYSSSLAKETDFDRLEAGELITLDWGDEIIILTADPLSQDLPPAGELLSEWIKYNNGFVDRLRANYMLQQMIIQMAPEVTFLDDMTNVWNGVNASTIIWDSNLKRLTVQATQYLPPSKVGEFWHIWGCSGTLGAPSRLVWGWVMNNCVSMEDHVEGARIMPSRNYARTFEVVYLEPIQ